MRALLFALAWIVAATPAAAQFKSPVAIIDASVDVRPFLPRLQAAGVAVIGRYLARCHEWDGKRLIDNGTRTDRDSEIAKIQAAGIGVLSIYQYKSQGALKFEGKWRNPKTDEVVILPGEDCIRTPAVPNTVEIEADLDGKAAVAQARAIGQPPGSAIYFGIDFNFDDSEKARRGLTTYLTVIARHLRAAGYKLGAYGSGSALFFLKPLVHEGRRLVDFYWLSGSRGHSGSAKFYNEEPWHLLQTWTDIHWFTEGTGGACVKGLELDPDIQNKRFAGTDIGFWRGSGAFVVPAQKTTAVFDSHRFVCNGAAITRAEPRDGAAAAPVSKCAPAFRDCDGEGSPRLRSCYASTVWIGRRSGAYVEVDYRGRGTPAGWTRRDNLSATYADRPVWLSGAALRKAAKCR